MARFTVSLTRAFGPAQPRCSAAAGALPPAACGGLSADGRRGPGWFESSWDLQRGLEVREGLPDDAKLQEWIEAFCLRAQPALDLVAA
jgi:hypothetical protein